MSGSASNPQQMLAANFQARNAVISMGVEMVQRIASGTITPANQPIVNVTPRNVGLIKGFWIEIVATVTNTAGSATLLTDWNAANILSNINFTDLNNNVRINTSGWHLAALAGVRNRAPYGSSTATDSPIKYGSNWSVISATASIAASGTGTVNMIYWVPLAYSDDDLRGAVYANVVNATMNLQFTVNANPSPASGNAVLSVYTGNAASITSLTYTVWQVYLDQLPMGQGGPVLPVLDISTIYEIKNTALVGLSVSQDFPIPFANFRSFLSAFVIYDNNGTLNVGTDINYFLLQSANYTNILNFTPKISALRTRRILTTDNPKGTYYFDFRLRPINTVQFGNMQLVMNPSAVTAGAQLLVGFESFAQIGTIASAGSLPAS